MSQLPADCLNEIFEYLEKDKVTLRSCLLVNRLWCEITVRILWRNIRNYNTLIACLPSESKEILYRNRIITSTSISKPPMFNYASFCKFLSADEINYNVERIIKKQQQSTLNDNLCIILQEVFKLFMSQISSLRKLEFFDLPL